MGREVKHGTLTALLEARSGNPSPFLVERGRAVSHRELLDASSRVARGLQLLGVGPGDRVALWMPNVPAWLAVFFACARLGAIAVSVNTRFRSHELADVLGRCGAKVLVCWPGFKGIDFRGILEQCDRTSLDRLESIVVYAEEADVGSSMAGKRSVAYAALAAGEALAHDAATPGSGCVLFTTSGTTKAPKFVLHDQETVIRHAHDVVRGFGLGPEAVMLLAPPLCGVFGFCCAMAMLAAGRPLVMSPAWDPAQAARDIVTHRVTHANATDDAILQLLGQDDAVFPFPSVTFFGYAAFNPALADIVARAGARGVRLVGLYGTSEIQALFARQDENAPAGERAQAGGRPVSQEAGVRARDPVSGAVLPHGQAGELEFFAPRSRMVRYYGDDEATAKAFTADGWYRSGDLGTTQADERFVFLARMGDSLRLGGVLVAPAELEEVAQGAPGIAACQVVGVPTARGLEAVALVILQPGAALDEGAVLAHVAGRLAKYKVPARVFAIDAFPVTPGANATKIQKQVLRDLAQRQMVTSRPPGA